MVQVRREVCGQGSTHNVGSDRYRRCRDGQGGRASSDQPVGVVDVEGVSGRVVKVVHESRSWRGQGVQNARGALRGTLPDQKGPNESQSVVMLMHVAKFLRHRALAPSLSNHNCLLTVSNQSPIMLAAAHQ